MEGTILQGLRVHATFFVLKLTSFAGVEGTLELLHTQTIQGAGVRIGSF